MLPLYPNPISLIQIRNEFGGSDARLKAYYSGGGRVPNGTIGYPLGAARLIPSGGDLSFGNFHGAVKEVFVLVESTQSLFIPTGVSYFTGFLIGGGGAGGIGSDAPRHGSGGGGGCGQVLQFVNLPISSSAGQNVSVVIGAGGSTYDWDTNDPNSRKGANSTFLGYVAEGGAGGGGYMWGTALESYFRGGNSAGSGGGGGGSSSSHGGSGGFGAGGRNGFAGTADWHGGGGAGWNGSGSNQDGGPGFYIDFSRFGFTRSVAGGGGGGCWSTRPGNAVDGGGAGSYPYTPGVAGTPGTGGGGGGGGESNPGGNGGSGLLVGVFT